MRATAWAAGPAAAAVVLAAGCGSAHYHAAGGGSQGRTTAAVTSGPATITRQDAERLARSLLSRAVLPAGARRFAGRPVKALGGPPNSAAGSPSVLLHQLWTVAEPAKTAGAFLITHVPAGMAVSGSGQAGQISGAAQRGKLHAIPPGGVQPGHVGIVTEQFVSYRLRRLPPGVSLAALSMTVAPATDGTSQLRADVQVTWYPPRSAAEYIPASMRAVTITASYLNPRPGAVRRTVTSAAVVRRLAALLNGAHAATGSVAGCPMTWVTYRLAFATAAQAAPGLTATYANCLTVQVTAGGRAQPPLLAPARLGAELASLMHVRAVPNTGVIVPGGGASPPRGTPASTPAGDGTAGSGAAGGSGAGGGAGGGGTAAPPVRTVCVPPLRGVWSGTPPEPMQNDACPAMSPAAP